MTSLSKICLFVFLHLGLGRTMLFMTIICLNVLIHCNVGKSLQGYQELSRKSEENKSFKTNQLAPSIYIMKELCFFSLDQWEIRIHLLWGKCFNIPHYYDPHLNQTKPNGLLPLKITGVLGATPERMHSFPPKAVPNNRRKIGNKCGVCRVVVNLAQSIESIQK